MKIFYVVVLVFFIGCSSSKHSLTNIVITDFVIHQKSDSTDILMFPPYIISDNIEPSRYIEILNEHNLIGNDSIRVDEYPELLDTPQPKYPIIAQRKGLEGEVFVRLWIKSDGTIRKAKAVIASDNIFVEPTLFSVIDWKFSPAKKNGKFIEVSTYVPLIFKLPKTP